MKRQFGLPAAFALTLLAFLFFGFTQTNRSRRPLPDKESVVVDYSFPPSPPVDALEEPDQATAASSSTLRPTQPERFDPVEQGTLTFAPLPRPPAVAHSLSDVATVDPQDFGVCGCGEVVGVPNGPVNASGLDNPPRASVQSPPAYPANARATGLGGEVWVEFAVDETGHVLRARVVRSSDPVFDEPTLRAVAKWRFEPGRKNGRPVSFRMVVPVTYRISE